MTHTRTLTVCLCLAAACFAATPARAAITLTPGLTSVGLDTESAINATSGTVNARDSIAPIFGDGYTEVSGLAGVTTSASNELVGSSYTYSAASANDANGDVDGDNPGDWRFNTDTNNGSGPGWIPVNNTTSADGEWLVINLTGASADGFTVAGIDLITLFVNRADGDFIFDYTTDANPDGANDALWTNIGTVTNEHGSTAASRTVFRLGFTFAPIDNVTGIRLELDRQHTFDFNNGAAFIGEIDIYAATAPTPAALPTGLAALGALTLRRRRR